MPPFLNNIKNYTGLLIDKVKIKTGPLYLPASYSSAFFVNVLSLENKVELVQITYLNFPDLFLNVFGSASLINIILIFICTYINK